MAVQTERAVQTRLPSGVRGLLRKDLAVFRVRDRFLVALVYLLGHPTVLPHQEAFFWLGIALVGALALYVPTIEWHQETDRMLSSLPVSRAKVVFSRYLSSLVACAVGAGAWVSTGYLLGPLLAAGRSTPGMWTTFPGITAFVGMAVLMISLFLPLYFRFGLGLGAIAFFALCLGLYVLASIPSGPVVPGEAVASWIKGMAESIGPGWVLFLTLAGLGVVVAASGRVSAGVFEKRDL